MDFNEINWHDSIIKSIIIDRNFPGKNDTVKFEIEWSDNGKGELLFEEVYWANLNLNFGIVAEESILSALTLGVNDTDLISLYTKWKGLINDVKLNVYIINLNSSGGLIKIIAKSFKVTKQPMQPRGKFECSKNA